MTQCHPTEISRSPRGPRRGNARRGNARRGSARWFGVLALLLLWGGISACDPSRPPKGTVLALKGNKGALCMFNRQCASNECRASHCTAKIEKVGPGGSCESDRYCLSKLYCDTSAKKCTPVMHCKVAAEPLKRCAEQVFLAFKPSKRRVLKRLRLSSRKRVVDRARRKLYRALCRLTQSNHLTYKRVVALQKALKITDCDKFAAAFRKAVGT